jgi:hypothetical protein
MFAEHVDALVLRGGCLPLGERGLPFAPVVDVLRGLVTRGLVADVPPTLARLGAGSGYRSVRDSEPVRRISSRRSSISWKDLSSDRTVVLIVEDVHWADRSTRELLSFAAHNLRDQRLLIVASFRTDDLDREHPLRLLLAELHRNTRVDRIELAAFTASDGRRLRPRPSSDRGRR